MYIHHPGIAQRQRYDAHNAKAMARAIELRGLNFSQAESADILNSENYRMFTGGIFTQSSVCRLLQRADQLAAASPPKVLPGVAVAVASNPPAETAIRDPHLAELMRMQEADQRQQEAALKREIERHHRELAPPKAPPIPTGPEFLFAET